ncbi:MAG: OmpA family protein [Fibrobacter sp.]|jgi:outer membrane protein OmpA-like peptidoglycan-associated protein|nr:OmpA family protein [Fibrobacter sp.]
MGLPATTRKAVKLISLSVIMMSVASMAAYNTNGELGVVRTYTAKTSGNATMNVGAGVSFDQSSEYLKGPNDGNVPIKDNSGKTVSDLETSRLLSSNVFLAFGVLNFWDIAVSLPFYYDWSGIEKLNEGGLGDLELSTKIRIPTASKIFYQAYLAAITIPTGMRKNGLFPRHSYYLNQDVNPAKSFFTASVPTFKAEFLLTCDLGGVFEKVPLQFHLNAGGVLSGVDQNNTIIAGFAFEYAPVSFFSIFTELWGETKVDNFSTGNFRSDPIYCSPGVKFTTPAGVYMKLLGDISLSSNRSSDRLNWNPSNGAGTGYKYSTSVIPKFGAQFHIGWNGFLAVQDDDRDGIKNDKDRCPQDPEDIDGFQDDDGCPDPDNDNDGIPDLKDKCPNDPEDKDGFEDEDGCPDLDNDGDGIPDLKDQCPNVAEDFDGFEDEDGCPDPDNDKDGIPDSLDKCPNEAEDFDGFEDKDGCPELDNDKDGIPDLKDKCPNEPETFNGFEDEDGCPDTLKKEPDMPKQQTIQGILFKSGSPEMTFESYQHLEPVIQKLKQYPEVEIEIRGHTDSYGNYNKNMTLSQMRAESVRQYMISKGIEASRLKAVGFGSSSPIADNRTAAGRAMNRRIEVVRTK